MVQSYNVKQVWKELNRNCFRTKVASGGLDRQFDVSVTGFQIHCRAHYVWRQEMSEGMIEPQSVGVFISEIYNKKNDEIKILKIIRLIKMQLQ